MWSFPQRGLLCVVSLDPRPHRLKPIGNSSADSSASAGGCYVWLCCRSSAEWLGTYADACRWRVGRAACPCSPVEVSFHATVTLLSTLLLFTCLWEGLGVWELWAWGCSGPRKRRDRCRATQGGLRCAWEGCWGVVGLQGSVSVGVLLLGSSWGSWVVLSSGWICCLVQPCVLGARQRAPRPARSCPLPKALLVGFMCALHPPTRMPCKSPWKTWENSSCGRKEAKSVALGFPATSVCLLPTQTSAVQAASRVVFCACPECVYARSPEAILLGGHIASCFKNGKLFLVCFLVFFLVSVLNSIASSQLLESSLSSHVVAWDSVPLGEGTRLRAFEGLQSPRSLRAVEVTRSHCYLQH